ncbi:ladderlectin-like isoform X1 [Epinephelus moara]|uniref:ladderlectin-like isoform X1 n=1 Tax=Epinephelus moara TaxID=300413 RepID=UPI00214E2DC1|nr:ladderlectin-like isoform X1 [Epinephelus moara]XP_049922624.1 ladderlectin-like isoform X2 [Epinephelus moara]XP_049922625.1 ladderlectin-like isoform X1 [Epinephelus moara]
MKMLIVSALVCAMVVLTRAAAPPEETPQDETESRLVKRWFLPKLWFKPKPWCKPRPCFKPRPCVKPRPCFKPRPCIKPRPCPVLPRPSVVCPSGWSKCRGHCYRYIPTCMTWTRAERNCQALGGNLASVHNFGEYQAIQNVIYRATRSKRPTWIGGSDAEEDGQWLWSDGTSFNYQNWCQKEPNNYGGRQSCIQMNFSDQKCWDDLQCSRKLPSVCVRNRRILPV